MRLASETLNAMGEVKPATMGEITNDEVPWLAAVTFKECGGHSLPSATGALGQHEDAYCLLGS